MPFAHIPGLKTYKRYLRYYLPEDNQVASDHAMLVTTLVNVSLLAAILVPAFLLEYAITHIWRLVVPLFVAGVVMVASPMIYRLSRSLTVARETFIAALFCFKLWECVVFGDVVSPGAVWFITMPLLAIMLGSVPSAIVWVIVTNTAMIVAHLMLGNGVVFPILGIENPHFLYVFSHIGASLAITVFLLMIEYSRRRAFQRLRIANKTISDLAIRDALTGVYNRRHIISEITRAEEDTDDFIVCLLDLDHFKQIN